MNQQKVASQLAPLFAEPNVQCSKLTINMSHFRTWAECDSSEISHLDDKQFAVLLDNSLAVFNKSLINCNVIHDTFVVYVGSKGKNATSSTVDLLLEAGLAWKVEYINDAPWADVVVGLPSYTLQHVVSPFFKFLKLPPFVKLQIIAQANAVSRSSVSDKVQALESKLEEKLGANYKQFASLVVAHADEVAQAVGNEVLNYVTIEQITTMLQQGQQFKLHADKGITTAIQSLFYAVAPKGTFHSVVFVKTEFLMYNKFAFVQAVHSDDLFNSCDWPEIKLSSFVTTMSIQAYMNKLSAKKEGYDEHEEN